MLEIVQFPNENANGLEDPNEENLVPVLGLKWDLTSDTLFCNSTYHQTADPPVTKRKILAVAQQIYDPLGIVCSFTLMPKLLLQECWKQKIAWDAELPEVIKKKFLNWQNQITQLKNIFILRWMTKKLLRRNSVVYTCLMLMPARMLMQLVFLSELKPKSPYLENSQIIKRPDLETHYWTDSSNALSWIKRDEHWTTFVANRTQETRALSHPYDWHHVPRSLNPADVPSRGSSVRYLIELRWLQGPEWLKSPPEEWPKSQIVADEESLNEERRKTAMIKTKMEISWYHNRFSSYSKIVRTFAWMKRFISNAKKLKLERFYQELTVKEIEQAELILLKGIQQEAFGSITNPVLKYLYPQLDEDGLIRVTTRLIQRDDTNSFKRPIILLSKHPVVHLLILEHHRRLNHAQNCRRFEVSNADVMPAPLPENRVKNVAAFEITGTDLGGPLYLRNGDKAWFVLFTCAVIQAVHIELVQSLSTETFCLAFRRFVLRRGRPLYVYSDNGTNTVGTNNIFHQIEWQKVQELALVKRIQWVFLPPTAGRSRSD
ncbi:uncharacterized protein LOC118192133 [Stegodyphus dumicola]|uniref:uncharacterized protein LOC118192133 n=1 Tax=Stegodyphus dumicola TaxID=202533 RepID=UPI0015AEBAFC|nr:uncharacterized protein LOC118192133 [Stegodyphus dumicola]